jgi:hypothetical protein
VYSVPEKLCGLFYEGLFVVNCVNRFKSRIHVCFCEVESISLVNLSEDIHYICVVLPLFMKNESHSSHRNVI